MPVNGAPFTDINVQLSWNPGTGAISHHVYLGTSMEDVQAGTADTDKGIVEVSSFTPEPLEYERTYYWRIDEDDGTSTYTGNIWVFNTAPELPIIDPALVGWWKLDEIEGIGALEVTFDDGKTASVVFSPKGIVSVDGTRGGFQAMVDGWFQADVECNPLLGPQVYEMALALMNGQPIEREVLTNETVYYPENAAELLPTRKY